MLYCKKKRHQRLDEGSPCRRLHAPTQLSYQGRPGKWETPALGKDALDSLTDLWKIWGPLCNCLFMGQPWRHRQNKEITHQWRERDRTLLPQKSWPYMPETEVQRGSLKCLVKASMNPSQIRAGSSSECRERSKKRPARVFYNHVRKLSLSILVAASTDSMSLRISELRASCRLGISSSPSTAMLSPSRVPRSTSVPGMASR